tara:strand:- start:98 stop:292 length:195 start_codon:yes stop_codon:yes gene_type:complete
MNAPFLNVEITGDGMVPTSIEQHLIEMGLLTLEELQARQSPTAPIKRPPDAFRDPRDANGDVPW